MVITRRTVSQLFIRFIKVDCWDASNKSRQGRVFYFEYYLDDGVIEPMQPEAIRKLLLGFPFVTEETPFGPDTVVYKTSGKMFALTHWESNPLTLNLKCDPDKALELRDQYRCVEPGYHMNKKHWNTVTCDGSVEDGLLVEWVSHSFSCVVKSMSKKLQQTYKDVRSDESTPATVNEEAQELRRSIQKGI